MMYKIRMVAIFALMVMFCHVGGADVYAANEQFHETYTVEPGTILEVSNQNGSVKIAKWDNAYVEVNAEKKALLAASLNNVDIKITAGATITIETVPLVKNPKVSVEYDIHVPADVVVRTVKTSNGEIQLRGTQGDVLTETSNGKIVAQEITGNVTAHTSNGAIEINNVMGGVDAKTSNGAIELVQVASISGAKTSNGRIKAEIRAIQGEKTSIQTSNGAITLYLSPELNADVDIRTSNGSIEIHGIEIVTKAVSKTKFSGKIGDGGKLLEVKTSNGSIEVNAL